MPNPQEPELRRSGRVPALDPDATVARRSADRRKQTRDDPQPVPPDQQPGHHPERDEDKPDLDAFADRLGTRPPEQSEGGITRMPWGQLLLAGWFAFVTLIARAIRAFVRRLLG